MDSNIFKVFVKRSLFARDSFLKKERTFLVAVVLATLTPRFFAVKMNRVGADRRAPKNLRPTQRAEFGEVGIDAEKRRIKQNKTKTTSKTTPTRAK